MLDMHGRKHSDSLQLHWEFCCQEAHQLNCCAIVVIIACETEIFQQIIRKGI